MSYIALLGVSRVVKDIVMIVQCGDEDNDDGEEVDDNVDDGDDDYDIDSEIYDTDDDDSAADAAAVWN